MAAPTVQVLLYLLGAWVDVSSYVSGQLSTNRGRSRETDRFTTGSCSFVLRNETRLFDPTNTASIYYPGIVPRTPVQVNVAGSRVFTGFVDDYDVTYQKPNICTVAVSCLDAFSILANTYVVNQSLVQQFSGARIAALLALNSYSGALNIATGQATIQAGTYGASFPGDVVLDDMQAITASEWGFLYMDRSGALQFQDRYRILEQEQFPPIVGLVWTPGGFGGNMLSLVDASFEAGVGNWGAWVSNCTVAQSAAQYRDGTHSLAVTSAAAGTMSCGPNTELYPVIAGVTYTAVLSSRAAATARGFTANISWMNSGGGWISTPSGSSVSDSTSAWTPNSLTATAPIGAAWATVQVGYATIAAGGEVHYVDCAGLYVGSSGPSGLVTTFSDVPADISGGAVPYFDIGMVSATRLLYNQVSGTRNGGTQQIVNNAASQTAYQLRSLALPTVENVNDAAVLLLCQYVLGIYQLPQTRFDTLEVELAGVSSAMQAALAALDITSLALVKRTPPGGGTPATISIQSYVESIAFALDVSGSTYRVKFGFGTVAPRGFILDSSAMGRLDINAIPY